MSNRTSDKIDSFLFVESCDYSSIDPILGNFNGIFEPYFIFFLFLVTIITWKKWVLSPSFRNSFESIPKKFRAFFKSMKGKFSEEHLLFILKELNKNNSYDQNIKIIFTFILCR